MFSHRDVKRSINKFFEFTMVKAYQSSVTQVVTITSFFLVTTLSPLVRDYSVAENANVATIS